MGGLTEKRKPTYDLDAFKAACARVEKLNVTGTALKGAAAQGFGRAGIVATIQTMQRSQFYKSMISPADHRGSGRLSIMCRRRRACSTSNSPSTR